MFRRTHFGSRKPRSRRPNCSPNRSHLARRTAMAMEPLEDRCLLSVDLPVGLNGFEPTIAVNPTEGTASSSGMQMVWVYVVPGLVLAIGLWLSYRVVNLPRFADFLIAVEAEMNKVSWPTRAELLRATLVVIVVVFVLALALFIFDAIWIKLFTEIGVLQIREK